MNSPTLTAVHGTQLGVILGTAAYMAPEQARGAAVDKRADIWAFGVVLYEMLTGKRLFGGETVTDTLAAVFQEDRPGALPADTPAARSGAPAPLPRARPEEPPARHRRGAGPRRGSGRRVPARVSRSQPVAPMGVGGAGRGGGGRGRVRRPPRRLHGAGRRGRLRAHVAAGVRSGHGSRACFGPDGRTVVYGAAWDGVPVGVRLPREARHLPRVPVAGRGRRGRPGRLLRGLARLGSREPVHDRVGAHRDARPCPRRRGPVRGPREGPGRR